MKIQSVSKALALSMLAGLITIAPIGQAQIAAATPAPQNISFNSGTCELTAAGYLGNGSEADPYQISDSASLWETADCSITNSQAAHFELLGDINVAGEPLAPTTSPIGSSTSMVSFQGSLDGNFHTISGIDISSPSSGVGLFTLLNNAQFKNLTIDGEIETTMNSGNNTGNGAGGLARKSEGHLRLEAFTSSVNVSGDDFVGGVVGVSYGAITVTNSSNVGDVSANGSSAGGFVGIAQGANASLIVAISGFSNEGSITAAHSSGGVLGASSQVTLQFQSVHNRADVSSLGSGGSSNTDTGGLVGFAESSVTIAGSSNQGSILGAGRNTGGLVGYQRGGTIEIVRSTNSGTVSGQTRVGGLVGDAANISISNAANSGTISSTTTGVNNNVGGFVGFGSAAAEIEDSINSGRVSAPNTAGGMIGYVTNAALFERVTNSAEISGDIYVAGLLAFAGAGATFVDAHNNGTINASDQFAGGLFGDVSGNVVVFGSGNGGAISADSFAGGIGANVDGGANFQSSSNRGDVTGGVYTGGIAGKIGLSATASALLNSGQIVGGMASGGLFGDVAGSLRISGSSNVASVTGEGLVGGLVGDSSNSTIVRSSNTGPVTGTANYAGGLLGQSSANTTIEHSFNTGDVIGADDVGGLVGWSRLVTIGTSFNTGDVAASMSDVAGRLESAGGFVGNAQLQVNIESSFNTGAVSSRLASGGFVGYSYVEVVVTKSYNVGAASTIAGGDEDGLIGIASDSSLVTVNGFYTSEESAFVSTSPVADLKSSATFLNWDFTNLWGFGTCQENNGFPMLRFANQVSSYFSTGCFTPAATQNPDLSSAFISSLPKFDKAQVRVSAGQDVLLTGTAIGQITSAQIAGQAVYISQLVATSMVLTMPNLEPGIYSLLVETDFGRVLYQGLIEIVHAGPVAGQANEKVLTRVNPRSSWLTRALLVEVDSAIRNQSAVTCIAYNDRSGVVARKKALSRAIHACSVARQLGLTTKVFVYGKAPNLADSVKILFR